MVNINNESLEELRTNTLELQCRMQMLIGSVDEVLEKGTLSNDELHSIEAFFDNLAIVITSLESKVNQISEKITKAQRV